MKSRLALFARFHLAVMPSRLPADSGARPRETGGAESGARAVALALVAAAVLAWPAAAHGQVFQGRVLEEGSEAPVPTAFVRLVDGEGEPVAGTLADSLGTFRLQAPGPGRYRLQVEHLGYRRMESRLLAVRDSTRAYPVELLLEAEPIPVDELVVSARRRTPAEVRNTLKRQIGLDPASLRWEPILRPTIMDHVERGHNVRDLVRWTSTPGLVVQGTGKRLCFTYRGRYCLPVYLDGTRLRPEFVSMITLEMIEAAVVLSPTESVAYERGGVLLYTTGWMR